MEINELKKIVSIVFIIISLACLIIAGYFIAEMILLTVKAVVHDISDPTRFPMVVTMAVVFCLSAVGAAFVSIQLSSDYYKSKKKVLETNETRDLRWK